MGADRLDPEHACGSMERGALMFRNEGFTLIELVIVMTVIAILTAIAIPQYYAYRMGSYNSAASSDLRNSRAVLESFYSDHRVYPSSAPGGAPGAGTVLAAAMNSTGAIAKGSISPPNLPVLPVPAPGFSAGLSQNVGLVVHTAPLGKTFTIGAKNASGDRCFGMDADPSAMYWVQGTAGSALQANSIPLALLDANNFLQGGGTAGSGVCAGDPPGSGQAAWTTL